MSDKLRIALLCNNKMAAMACQRMAGAGELCGIATADTDAEVVNVFGAIAKAGNVPYRKITTGSHMAQLGEWLEAVQPDVVFVISFPWRIPAQIFGIPEMGFLNFHPGLLPGMR